MVPLWRGTELHICISTAYFYFIGTHFCNRNFSYVLCLLFFYARVMVAGLASPPLEAGAWLAVGRGPLGRRLPPREPLRVCPRGRDRAEHEADLQLYMVAHIFSKLNLV